MKIANVCSALPLTDEEKDSAQKKIKNIFPDQERVGYTVDKSILGGIIFKTDEKTLDLSVKEELRRLEQELGYD